VSQSRMCSALEAGTNIAVGIVVSLVANAIVFPLFHFRPSGVQNAEITAIYTAISFVRSYCLRRAWNAIGKRRA
jgi:hypothetical protein